MENNNKNSFGYKVGQALGFDLETILQMNVEKLKARYPHGFDAGHSQHRSSGDI